MEEKKGLGYVLKHIFFKPVLAFDNFKIGPAIIFALILMFSASIFNGIAQFNVGKEMGLTDMQLTDEMIEKYRDMGYTEEQIKEIEKTLESEEYKSALGMIDRFSGLFSVVGGFFAGVGVVIGWLIKGGIITLIFSFMGAKPKFSQSMGIIGLSWIPFFIREVLRGITTLVTGQPVAVASNVLNNFDIFVLWNVILLIIGFSVCLKITKKRAAAVVIGYWIFTLLIHYGLDQLGQFLTKGITL